MNTTDKVVGHVRAQTPPNQQVYGASPATFGEKHRCLTGRVSRSHDGHILIVIKRSFYAGTCMMDAGGFKSLRAFDGELPPADAGRRQNRASPKLCAAIEMESMETVGAVCGIDSVDKDGGHHFGAELEHLQDSARGEFGSRKSV